MLLMSLCLKRDKRNRREHDIPVAPAILVIPVKKVCLYVAYVFMSKKRQEKQERNEILVTDSCNFWIFLLFLSKKVCLIFN